MAPQSGSNVSALDMRIEELLQRFSSVERRLQHAEEAVVRSALHQITCCLLVITCDL
jgi:hypothetical protein